MRGVEIDAPWKAATFTTLFAPVLDGLDELFWYLDLQSGPFMITAQAEYDRLEAELTRHHVDTPELAETSAGLWRPGILSQYGSYMVVDEGGYMAGFPGPEDCVRQVVAGSGGEGQRRAFGILPEVLITTEATGDGAKLTWRLYSKRQEWRDRLKGAGWRDTSETALPSAWGRAPQ